MRYRVRSEKGEELECPSLGDLHALYRQGFLADDDLVRQESAVRWERVGDFPALQGERGRRREGRGALLLLGVAALVVLALWLALRGR
ncbi:MAG TPA: hypothetical protein VMT17_16350 [Anaeromyxobacteraceae bacterium]|nr:hypothetical protein [Anaeromyxobacteraceae bacterium]